MFKLNFKYWNAAKNVEYILYVITCHNPYKYDNTIFFSVKLIVINYVIILNI